MSNDMIQLTWCFTDAIAANIHVSNIGIILPEIILEISQTYCDIGKSALLAGGLLLNPVSDYRLFVGHSSICSIQTLTN